MNKTVREILEEFWVKVYKKAVIYKLNERLNVEIAKSELDQAETELRKVIRKEIKIDMVKLRKLLFTHRDIPRKDILAKFISDHSSELLKWE